MVGIIIRRIAQLDNPRNSVDYIFKKHGYDKRRTRTTTFPTQFIFMANEDSSSSLSQNPLFETAGDRAGFLKNILKFFAISFPINRR